MDEDEGGDLMSKTHTNTAQIRNEYDKNHYEYDSSSLRIRFEKKDFIMTTK